MTTTYAAETNGNEVTSYIPLITSFASVPGCSDSFMLEGTRLVAFDPAYGLSVNTGVRCQPPAVTRWWNQAALPDDPDHHTAFSLGPLQCPNGWNTLASSIVDTVSTLALCCPPGYTLRDGQRGQAVGDCISDIPAGATLTYASGTGTRYTLTVTALSSQSTVGAIGVLGWNIKARSTSATTSAATAPTSTTPTATALPTPSTQANTGGLSHSATVGIAVGASLGVLGLIALVATIYLLRRHKRAKSSQPAASGIPYEKTELDATTSQAPRRGEPHVKSQHSAYSGTTELDSTNQPPQLSTYPPPQVVYRPAHELQ